MACPIIIHGFHMSKLTYYITIQLKERTQKIIKCLQALWASMLMEHI